MVRHGVDIHRSPGEERAKKDHALNYDNPVCEEFQRVFINYVDAVKRADKFG